MAPVLELAIGLIFIYLTLSLIVSAIQEGIAGLFGWRSTYLERGIKSLLGATLTGKFFDHGLIRSLRNETAKMPFNRKPSYVSASTFTETILDLVRRAQPSADADRSSGRSDTSEFTLRDLRERIEALRAYGEDVTVLRESLRVLTEAARDLEDLKRRIDAWFEEAMNRVSGWYKRFSRLIAFVIGVILVALLNADSVNIASFLWRSPPIRAAVVEQASRVAEEGQPDAEEAQAQLEQLEELQLPLGWVIGPDREDDPRRWPVRPIEYPGKILGLLLTAVALTFGAPFWFDLLKRFVGVRSSGAEPQPAQTGPPSGGAEQPERLPPRSA